jgi:SAM-dependent methyltransferase
VSTDASAFDQYAAWYNGFNKGKDYAGETQYLREQIRPWCAAPERWLDIGCGTGGHLAYLRDAGIAVEGLDASAAMIAQARAAHPQIPFHIGSAQGFQLPGRWDVVSMLFHVMSYQTTDAQVEQALQKVAAHVMECGVFVFDFWHTAGVLHEPPAYRVRESHIGGRSMYRVSRPTEYRELNRVDVLYEFRWDAPDGPCVHEEHHAMRHFAPHELAAFLDRAGLAVVSCKGWKRERAPSPDDWYGLICARRH